MLFFHIIKDITLTHKRFRKDVLLHKTKNWVFCPRIHHISTSLHFDSFLPKFLPRHCYFNGTTSCCRLAIILKFTASAALVVVVLSVLFITTDPAPLEACKKCGIVYPWWFSVTVMPCLCLLLGLPLRAWHTGSFWLCNNLDFTMCWFIFTHKTGTKTRKEINKYRLLKGSCMKCAMLKKFKIQTANKIQL